MTKKGDILTRFWYNLKNLDPGKMNFDAFEASQNDEVMYQTHI
jgi:hypothetical protein